MAVGLECDISQNFVLCIFWVTHHKILEDWIKSHLLAVAMI